MPDIDRFSLEQAKDPKPRSTRDKYRGPKAAERTLPKLPDTEPEFNISKSHDPAFLPKELRSNQRAPVATGASGWSPDTEQQLRYSKGGKVISCKRM